MPTLAQPRVILTRPAPQAPAWATALTEAGFDVALLPLINIQLLAPPAELPNLANYEAVFLVSRNALDGLLAWNGPAALQAANCRWLCPGAGTAQALLDLGISPRHIVQPAANAPQDSEHLWLALQAQQTGQALPAGSRLLVVKGSDAAHRAARPDAPNWLGQQAAAQGVQVTSINSYQRSAPELTVAQAELAQAAAQDGSIWLFSSSQAIANLAATLPEQNWAATPCLATHPRIAQTAAKYGFHAQICPPNLNDIAHALHSVQASQA
jgi:uroporphyrinogen-III synthase